MLVVLLVLCKDHLLLLLASWRILSGLGSGLFSFGFFQGVHRWCCRIEVLFSLLGLWRNWLLLLHELLLMRHRLLLLMMMVCVVVSIHHSLLLLWLRLLLLDLLRRSSRHTLVVLVWRSWLLLIIWIWIYQGADSGCLSRFSHLSHSIDHTSRVIMLLHVMLRSLRALLMLCLALC